jgi:hypothetical protein
MTPSTCLHKLVACIYQFHFTNQMRNKEKEYDGMPNFIPLYMSRVSTSALHTIDMTTTRNTTFNNIIDCMDVFETEVVPISLFSQTYYESRPRSRTKSLC